MFLPASSIWKTKQFQYGVVRSKGIDGLTDGEVQIWQLSCYMQALVGPQARCVEI
jgi:hypothetical protein